MPNTYRPHPAIGDVFAYFTVCLMIGSLFGLLYLFLTYHA